MRKLILILLACSVTSAVITVVAAQTGGLYVPGVSRFPSGIDDLTTLWPAVNNASTTVSRTVNSGDSTIYVSSTGSFGPTGVLTIGPFNSASSEVVLYTGKTSTSFTGCTRGKDGSVATTHAVGETVSVRLVAGHINNLDVAVQALETKLGIGSGTPGASSVLIGGVGGSSNWAVPGPSVVSGWLGFTPVNKAGDTMNGLLILSADPASALGAATKQYVDARAGVVSFNTRTGSVSLLPADISGALGYTPQPALTFAGAIQDSSNTVSCPTCEVTSNKNIANGYAGLGSGGKVGNSLLSQVLAVTDLTTYTGISGSGSTAIGATITSPAIGQSLVYDGSKWINQTIAGGSGAAYNTLAYQGVAVTQRAVLNLIGSAFTLADNPGQTRTDLTLNESPNSSSVVGIGRQVLTGTGLTGGGDLSADRTLSVLANSTNQQVQVLNSGGSLIGTRHALQFLTGGALSWTLADDAVNDKLTVTPLLSVTPGGSSTLVGQGRALTTTAPLSGGGDLSSDRTLSIGGLSSVGSPNQLIGVLGAGGGWEYKTLSGTTNQVGVAFASGGITLSLPQSIDTGSSPVWAGVNVTGLSGLVLGSATGISGSTAFNLSVSSAGTKPQIRYQSTGTGTGAWQFSNDGVTFTPFPTASGITQLNGLTGAAQSFAVGTSGTDFGISSAGTTHTFNIPDAGASARGLVTTGAQTFAGAKTFSSAPLFTGFTTGSVLFAGSGGLVSQDNSHLFWDSVGLWLSTAILDQGGTVFNVKAKAYGAKGNARQVTDGAMTSGAPTLTSATAGFTSGDAGKTVVVKGAGAAGADLVTTILSFSNSTTVTLNTNAGTTVSGKSVWYGTDDTTAIKAAITAAGSGGTVSLPQGNYLVSTLGTLSIGVNLVSQGMVQAQLVTTSSTADLVVAGGNNQIDGVAFNSAITRTAGSFISAPSVAWVHIQHCEFNNAWNGITISGTSNTTYVTQCEWGPGLNDGILVSVAGGNDHYFDHLLINGQARAGVELTGESGFVYSNSDTILCGTALLIDPSSGANVQYCKFVGDYFDTSTSPNLWINPAASNNVWGLAFTNCWFDTGSAQGVLTGNTGAIDDIHFVGCQIMNNVGDGLLANTTNVTNLVVEGCTVAGNSRNSAGTHVGINIGVGVSGFNISGNRIGSAAGYGATQGYGININAGSSDNFIITGNDLRGNTIAGLANNGTGTNVSIANNVPLISIPSVEAYNTTNESIPSGTPTALTFNSERYNNGALHSTSVNTSRITITQPGIYNFSGGLEIGSSTAGIREVYFRINGSVPFAGYFGNPTTGGNDTILSIAGDRKFNPGDYVELVVFQNSGGALNAVASFELSPELKCHYVGP